MFLFGHSLICCLVWLIAQPGRNRHMLVYNGMSFSSTRMPRNFLFERDAGIFRIML